MKILIISDTHGRQSNLKKVLEREGRPDHVLHLGDVEHAEERIIRMVGCPVDMVAGNCDYFSDLPSVKIVELDGCRIMMTHGHYYFVSVGVADLADAAKENNCDVVMFGHTHKPLFNEDDDKITILNPGSLSYPRQEGRKPSYIMMETYGDGKADFEVKYL